jgi:zinc protease
MHRFIPVPLILAGLAGPVAAQPPGVTKGVTVEGITQYALPNGLQILLLPDPSQPKVTVNLTVFVGSRHEGYGETGMAHLLEHMVFKGCPKFPDVPKALRDHGANFNGTTWLDRTNYYETMPATDENLRFGIELEADRMANSFIKREELMKEFTVVRNEFEQGENSPEAMLSQRMTATAFEWHNYGKSTIGNKTDIERVPIDNLQAFYKKYYRPDNALLIVAGKFDEAKALEYAAKYFGPIKNPGDPVPQTYTEEPPQDGERLVTLRRVGTVGAVGVVYHTPAGPGPEFAACEVLESCLTDEPAGRLYKALVEPKLATSLSGSINPTHDPGVIEIVAQTEPAKTEEARRVMVETLENLSKQPITPEEVERVKRRLLQRQERTLANSQSFAVGLSDWAGAGDWRLFFLHRDRLEKVTAADVNAVAAKYLVRSNRTVGVYSPTETPERAEVAAAPALDKLLADYKGRAAMTAGEAFDPTPENVEARVKRGKLESGVEYALLAKKTRGETVNLVLNLRFGSAESLKGKVSACEFVGSMLMRGTKTKTRQQIKDEFDKLNAAVSVSSDLGTLAVSVQTKRANLPAVLTLLKEVLREPAFPADEFELLKREQLEALDKARTEPQQLAVVAARRKVNPYPPDDVRYAPTIPEEIDRVKGLTVAQVKDLYDAQVGGTVGQLAVVGDFDPDAATKLVGEALAGWKASVPFARVPRPAVSPNGGTEKIETPDKANAVYVAMLPLPVGDADPAYAPLAVGNYVLGAAPLASRLSNRVRGKDGLSYGVGSQLSGSAVDKSGMFLVFAITNPANIDKVDAAIGEEVKKFLADGVTETELGEAKAAYLAAQKVARGNDRTLAGQLAGALYAGRTFGYYADFEKAVAGLTPAAVTGAFGKYVAPKDLATVEAGDFKKK